MIEIWQECAKFQTTTQRLADQVRKIIKKGWFSDLEILEIKKHINKAIILYQTHQPVSNKTIQRKRTANFGKWKHHTSKRYTTKCYVLTFDPAQKNAIPRWCTRRKWHIPMASNRKRSRERIKAYNMGQGEGPTVAIQTDAPEESDLWTAWQLFSLDDD